MTDEELERLLAEVLDHTIYLAKGAFQHVAITHSARQRFCVAPLVVKALHKAHALNLLVKERLMEEAETILRILIEVSFVIGAIARDAEFVPVYARAAFVQKRRELQQFVLGNRELPRPILTPEQVEDLEKRVAELALIIKRIGARSISTKEYAERAGLLALYHINYSRLSASVHSGPEDIDRFIKKDAERNLLAIGAPDVGRPDVILWVGIESMVRVLHLASGVFELCILGLAEVDAVYRGMSSAMFTEMKII
jgi:uncharacterized protein DUF5677